MDKPQPEIRAPGIDVDRIMATIRHNIQRRHEEGLYQAISFPEFESVAYPEEPAGEAHNPLFYFHLRELNRSYSRLPLELDLSRSRLEALPLFGLVWNTLRRHLHTLAIFYANKVARHVITLNRHVVVILNSLTRHDQKRDAELAELKQRLAELEARLAQLEEET